MGARFVELPLEGREAEGAGGYARHMGKEFYRRQSELLRKVVAENDVVITAAAVPGQRSPVLVTREMIAGMKPGSVIVDIAGDHGGNCELTQPGKTVVEHGVTLIGAMNVTSTIPLDASRMYSKNIASFLLRLIEDGEIRIDREDEIIQAMLVARGGEVVHPDARAALGWDSQEETDGGEG